MEKYQAKLDAARKEHDEIVAATEQSGWKSEKAPEGVSLLTKELPGSKIHAIRAEISIEGVTAKECNEILAKFTKEDWGTLDEGAKMTEYDIVEQIDANTKVNYEVESFPFPLWARDFVMITKTEEQKDKSQLFIATSIDHPSKPENPKQYVRGNTIVASFLFTDSQDGKTTQAVRVLHADPNGDIPTSLINRAEAGFGNSMPRLSALIKKHAGK